MWVLLLSPLDRWGELRHGEAESLDQRHRPTKFGWTGVWTQAVRLRSLALNLRRHACPASSCPQRRARFLASRPLFDSLTLNLSPRGSPQHTDPRSCPNCTPGGLALHRPVISMSALSILCHSSWWTWLPPLPNHRLFGGRGCVFLIPLSWHLEHCVAQKVTDTVEMAVSWSASRCHPPVAERLC